MYLLQAIYIIDSLSLYTCANTTDGSQGVATAVRMPGGAYKEPKQLDQTRVSPQIVLLIVPIVLQR